MSQIKDKEAADVLSKHISDEFQKLQEQLKNLAHERLLQGASKTPQQWQARQNANMKAFEKEVEQQCTKLGKSATKGFNSDIKHIAVAPGSVEDETVSNLYDILGKNVISEFKKTVNSVGRELKSQVAPSLYQTIATKINQSAKQPYVVYKDGKHMRLENYMEMRLRTDINHEVAKNFLDINQELGQVFYICSEHGNCADDHIDYQGKVYCSQNWEEACPEKFKDQVAAYIEENHIMSIEDAMGEEGNYLTTRPNCRHYFQMISISSVLDIKSEQDRENYLKEAGMSYNTSYKEEGYKALGEQRYNERQIREWRERYDTMKLVIDNRPKVDLRSADEETKKFYQRQNAELKYYSMKLRSWQSRQRQHMQTNPGLDRWYGRERYNRLFKRVSSNNMNAPTMVKDENNKQYYDSVSDRDDIIEAENSSSGYKYCNTIDEVNSYAEELGVEKADFKGVNVEVANEIVKSIYEAVSVDKRVLERLKFVGTTQNKNKLFKADLENYYYKQLKKNYPGNNENEIRKKAKKYASASIGKTPERQVMCAYSGGCNSTDKEVVEICKKYAGITVNKNMIDKDCQNALKYSVQTKFHPVNCDTIKSCSDHEIGHIFDYIYDLRYNKDIQEMYNSRTHQQITDELSEYAWNNHSKDKYSEFIAEAWSEYKNNPSPREIAKNIGKIIEEAMKNE